MLRLKTREELEKEEVENSTDYEARLVQSDVAGMSRGERRARARAIMKQQRRAVPQQQQRPREEGQEDVDEDQQIVPHNNNNNNAAPVPEHGVDEQEPEPTHPQLSRKERQKKAKAAEKEERNLRQEERRKYQQEVETAAKKERLDREKRQRMEQEEERRQNRLLKAEEEEKRRLEHETFLSTEHESLMVDQWIHEMQSIRSISIDELARRFGVSSECVGARIQELIAEQRVAGCITKQGQFVYVSEDEMKQVTELVSQRSQVSGLEIVEIFNSVIGQTSVG